MQEIENFNKILRSFNIKAECVSYSKNDNYFHYDIKLSPLSKIKDIIKMSTELSLAIKSQGKPNIKPIYDQGIVRLEFICKREKELNLFEYFSIDEDVPNGDLICLLGQDVTSNRVWMDLSKNPHMLISGTTGSGKSTLLHNIIANLYNYNDAILFLVDPKGIEFVDYDNALLKNLRVDYTYKDAIKTLDMLHSIMEHRFNMLKNKFNADKIPYIVLIIDEFADLILQDINNEFHNKLCKLAQKCRAAKINIILATQRPSANIINGAIKANFPARIACKVSSNTDSRIILDNGGAENLNGFGDALLKDHLRYLQRFQVAYTSSKEICSYFGNANV